MAVDRLCGSDSTLYKYTFGAPLVTGTATKGAMYKIVARTTGTTVFPTGYAVGDLWQGDGVKAFTADESASLGTAAIVADCSSFSFDIAADSIEVTVLADNVKKYRKGKNDMTGSVTGINFISEMRKAGSILNRFLKVIVGDDKGNSAPVVNSLDGSDFFIKAYLNDETAIGDTQVYLFGQVELYGYKIGADIGSAQEWTSDVKFIGADPVIFILDNETLVT